MNALRFLRRRYKLDRKALDVTPDVRQAMDCLRAYNTNYQILLAAVKCAVEGDVGALRAFCEDFGLDQVDPITKADVLAHALQLVRQNHGDQS